MEALGKLNYKDALPIINMWIESHKEMIINEKQFFVLNHARIVLAKLSKGVTPDPLVEFDEQFNHYLENYSIL